MKKLSLKKMNLVEGKILEKNQLKAVVGGYEGGYYCYCKSDPHSGGWDSVTLQTFSMCGGYPCVSACANEGLGYWTGQCGGG
jgi:hypothetical protein